MDKRKKGHQRKVVPRELRIPKGSRKLHIGDTIWHWKTKGGDVTITRPDGTKVYVGCPTIIGGGCTWDNWERGQYKGYSHMTPGKVKEYIEGNLV